MTPDDQASFRCSYHSVRDGQVQSLMSAKHFHLTFTLNQEHPALYGDERPVFVSSQRWEFLYFTFTVPHPLSMFLFIHQTRLHSMTPQTALPSHIHIYPFQKPGAQCSLNPVLLIPRWRTIPFGFGPLCFLGLYDRPSWLTASPPSRSSP